MQVQQLGVLKLEVKKWKNKSALANELGYYKTKDMV